MVSDRQTVDAGADAGRLQAEGLGVENLAALRVDLRVVEARLVLQHGERERDLRGSGIQRI